MHAMLIEKPKQKLVFTDVIKPNPNENEVLIQVSACRSVFLLWHFFDAFRNVVNVFLVGKKSSAVIPFDCEEEKNMMQLLVSE